MRRTMVREHSAKEEIRTLAIERSDVPLALERPEPGPFRLFRR